MHEIPSVQEGNDSHNHLFFESEFSKKIWEKLKEKMENRWLSNNSIGSVLMRIVLATVVYYIWKERNTRLFTGEEMDVQGLLKIIIENIKL